SRRVQRPRVETARTIKPSSQAPPRMFRKRSRNFLKARQLSFGTCRIGCKLMKTRHIDSRSSCQENICRQLESVAKTGRLAEQTGIRAAKSLTAQKVG